MSNKIAEFGNFELSNFSIRWLQGKIMTIAPLHSVMSASIVFRSKLRLVVFGILSILVGGALAATGGLMLVRNYYDLIFGFIFLGVFRIVLLISGGFFGFLGIALLVYFFFSRRTLLTVSLRDRQNFETVVTGHSFSEAVKFVYEIEGAVAGYMMHTSSRGGNEKSEENIQNEESPD